MFQSERFFCESWPMISQFVGSPEDATRSVRWILDRAAVAAGARVLDDAFRLVLVARK